MSQRTRTEAEPARTPGTINAHEVYTRTEFLARSGMSVAAFTAAKKAGLRTRTAGKRTYIASSDFVDWLTRQ